MPSSQSPYGGVSAEAGLGTLSMALSLTQCDFIYGQISSVNLLLLRNGFHFKAMPFQCSNVDTLYQQLTKPQENCQVQNNLPAL